MPDLALQQAVANLTNRFNQFLANAKKVDQLVHQEILKGESKIHVSIDGESQYLTLQQILSEFVTTTYKELVSVGSIDLDEETLKITFEDIVWKIAEVTYTKTTDEPIEIPLAFTDKIRGDIFVGYDDGEIVRIAGPESDSVAIFPAAPFNAVFITQLVVTDAGITETPTEPILGTNYVEKETFSPLTYTNTGVVGSIEIGKRSALKVTGTVSEIGNIIKNNAQDYYAGQFFVLIDNTTSGNIKLPQLNTSGGGASIAWFHPDGQNYFTTKDEVVLFVLDYIGSQKVYRRVSGFVKNKSVTLEKIQDFPAGHILGRLSETDGQAEFLDAFDVLFWLGLDDVDTNLALKQDKLNKVVFGQVIDDELAIKSTPSPNDEFVVLDSATGEAVSLKYDSLGFVLKKSIITNITVTGTYNLDASLADTYNLTLTGNTTLALINTSSTFAEPMTVYITGNFSLAYPAGSTIIGVYIGSMKNQLVIEKIASVIYITVNNYV